MRMRRVGHKHRARSAVPGAVKKALVTAGPLALAIAGAPLGAQVAKPEPGVEEIARTPIEDLNLDPGEIPPVLIDAAENPYAQEKLTDCNAIVAEIARIDTVLGHDYDLLGKQENGLQPGKIAKGIVGSLIPFRSIVREITGAAGDKRKTEQAVTAGMVRRGFLKGLGLGRGCDYPARPRAMTMVEERKARDAERDAAREAQSE